MRITKAYIVHMISVRSTRSFFTVSDRRWIIIIIIIMDSAMSVRMFGPPSVRRNGPAGVLFVVYFIRRACSIGSEQKTLPLARATRSHVQRLLVHNKYMLRMFSSRPSPCALEVGYALHVAVGLGIQRAPVDDSMRSSTRRASDAMVLRMGDVIGFSSVQIY